MFFLSLQCFVGGAHVLCAPLFYGLLIDNSLVPQRIDGLLSLLREEVGHERVVLQITIWAGLDIDVVVAIMMCIKVL